MLLSQQMLQRPLSLDHMTLLAPVLILELIRQVPLELTKAGHPHSMQEGGISWPFSRAKQYYHSLHNFP